ncbi:MAG: hypothetical protein GFH27_549297n199 [Chloroflexi bacterium AL-W]|nr:hypothetical protein [Chloroflexi bacterium AL-N1]NOK68947.1 hypothetical protein [Chloroflexi bacterium AL-N10]NOK76930.1 hypothetical protein [Chloroflexi bacterium AL-N5]NOK82682.1 hypothetical protein [Chloroflexi bacterium AL-W]NOK90787.1 hypothetical protein [Chloroflexi bacterium AL-N15]
MTYTRYTTAYNKATPHVSIIVPCYNHGQYLPEAISSVVVQTYCNWEIIIVDDGSTDDSVHIAEQLLQTYDNFPICLLSHPNQGLGPTRNAGIRIARGTYILPLDADDLIKPTMLEQTVVVLEEDSHLGVVYTSVQMFGAETNTWSGGEYDIQKLRFDNQMNVTALFRKKAWEQVGGFRDMSGMADWDFWLSLAEAGWYGKRVAQPLFCYRRANNSMLTTSHRKHLGLRAQIILNHPNMYEPGFITWAYRVCSPTFMRKGIFRSPRHWLWAFTEYMFLIAQYRPQLLPKTALREVFNRLSARQQGYARRMARYVRLSQGG